MQTLAQFRKGKEKIGIKVEAGRDTYWDRSIDDTIKELRKIKGQVKGFEVKMALETEYGRYGDRDRDILVFYYHRPETKKEFDDRTQKAYDDYVKREEWDLKQYEALKIRLGK